jgi:probable phosphoglycerate mutase
MRIIFARHGQSQANLLEEISNRGLKHPLTRLGRQQAAELAERLGGEAVGRIYTSPMLRAIETTTILANRLDVEYEVAAALGEFDCGIAEGRADERAWDHWRWVVAEWRLQRRYQARIEGGESFEDLRARFVPFIDGLLRQHGESQSTLLCIAHGGLYWMMLPLVVSNLDSEQIDRRGLDYTTYLTCELRPAGLVCTAWNGQAL